MILYLQPFISFEVVVCMPTISAERGMHAVHAKHAFTVSSIIVHIVHSIYKQISIQSQKMLIFYSINIVKLLFIIIIIYRKFVHYFHYWK